MGKDYYNNKAIYQNQANHRMAYNHYQPVAAASAPTLEININQNELLKNNADTSRSPSVATPRRPPSCAPPPPPVMNDYTQPAYNPMWFDRFPRRENRGMFRLALVEAMLAAIWTGAFFLLNAIVGSAAAKVPEAGWLHNKIGSINLYMAHLVMSLICIGLCLKLDNCWYVQPSKNRSRSSILPSWGA